jgi:hypothetical protein
VDAPRIVIGLAEHIGSESDCDDKCDQRSLRDIAEHSSWQIGDAGTFVTDEVRITTGGPPTQFRRPVEFYDQPYLAKAGINLPIFHQDTHVASWRRYDGTGVQFSVVEEGWNTEHEAFNQEIRNRYPRSGPHKHAAAHGSAVLGIVMANGSKSRIRGIAPGCTLAGLYALKDAQAPRLENAIRGAAQNLDAGDVLLLPLQITATLLPVEVTTGVFRAIRSAVTKGIIVIEAAGNERGPLEEHLRPPHHAAAWIDDEFNDRIHGIPDSGAIMVGGCKVPQYGDKYSEPRQDENTHSGARIDCCAWSRSVWTSFSDDPSTYGYFHDTSAAAPIIAGLALIVQQCAKERLGRPLTPLEMRELFRDADCGTEVQPADTAWPVRMPDACKLFAKVERMT